MRPSSPAVIDFLNCTLVLAGGNKAGNRRARKPSSTTRKSASSRSNGTRVLLFSGIWELVLYRAEVLRDEGYKVITPRTKEEAEQAIRRGDLDVVVLTYTLPNETVQELTELLRESCPGCRLIAVAQSATVDRRIAPDAIALADQGPAGLVKAVRRVTRPN